MSATRLLVLGATNFMQPVTGYAIRRELVGWRLDDHVNVKPGSIYSAIRTLAKDGCLRPEQADAEPVRWCLTEAGENELTLSLRESWWTLKCPSQPLLPAMTMMPMMPRAELVRALNARVGQLEVYLDGVELRTAMIEPGATGEDGEIPEHVREILAFLAGQARAEADWARTLIARLEAGEYPTIHE